MPNLSVGGTTVANTSPSTNLAIGGTPIVSVPSPSGTKVGGKSTPQPAGFDFAGGEGEPFIEFGGYKYGFIEILLTVFIAFIVYRVYRK